MAQKTIKHQYNIRPCPACKAQGKNVWHRGPSIPNRKVTMKTPDAPEIRRMADIAMSLGWIFVKSLIFGFVLYLFSSGTAYVNQISGIGWFVYFVWSISGKIFSGRWRRIIQIIITQKTNKRIEVEDSGVDST